MVHKRVNAYNKDCSSSSNFRMNDTFPLTDQIESVTLRMMEHSFDEAVVSPKKKPALKHDKKMVTLSTNVYPLEVSASTVYRYDTSMKLVTENREQIDLLFKGNANSDITDRAKLCMFLLRKALEQYRVISDSNFIVHDGASAVYCTEDMGMALKPHNFTLTVGLADLPVNIRSLVHTRDAREFVIQIQTCGEGGSLNTADYTAKQLNRNMEKLDRTFKQFFDLLTSQDAVKDGRFQIIRAGKLFDRYGPRKDLGFGQERALGIDKSIKFIEGTSRSQSNSVVPALVLDSKVGDFYKNQSLKQTILELLRHLRVEGGRFPFGGEITETGGRKMKGMNSKWRAVNEFVKGLRVQRIQSESKKCSFVAVGITQIPISEIKEDSLRKDGPKEPMMARFRSYGPKQIEQSFPAVIFRGEGVDKRKKVTIHYPMELLIVAEGQIVPQSKAIAEMAGAVKPTERFRDISNQLKALNLHDGGVHNQLLAAFGIKVADKPLKVQGFERQKPQVGYYEKNNKGTSLLNTDSKQGNWKSGNTEYYIPARISIIHIIGRKDIIKTVETAIKRTCPARGMSAEDVILRDFVAPRDPSLAFKKLEAIFTEIKAVPMSNRFIIFVDHKDNKSHHDLKLLERRFCIRTMHITEQVARDLLKRPATCDNIVHKMNEKAGGVNHIVKPDKYGATIWNECPMFIGMDVAHPGPPSRDEVMNGRPPHHPSVVGFSFNGGADISAFIGDFHYQKPRQERISDNILNSRMKWMLNLFRKNRNGTLPNKIFVIRDGVSEGQYAMAIRGELAAMREAVEEYKNMEPALLRWKPVFSFIIVTKRHNMRFTSHANSGEAFNPNAGTFVDEGVTRPDMTEFYMQPHKAIKGTAKSTSIQILKDGTNMSMDEAQAILHALTYCHKITESSISLPEPIYQADEWAKRGDYLIKAYAIHHNFPLLSNYDRQEYSSAPIDWEKMSRQLGNWNTELEMHRVNA